MSQPAKSRRTLWIVIGVAILVFGLTVHFLGSGDAIGFLQRLHGN